MLHEGHAAAVAAKPCAHGRNEALDSQLVMMQYLEQYGVGAEQAHQRSTSIAPSSPGGRDAATFSDESRRWDDDDDNNDDRIANAPATAPAPSTPGTSPATIKRPASHERGKPGWSSSSPPRQSGCKRKFQRMDTYPQEPTAARKRQNQQAVAIIETTYFDRSKPSRPGSDLQIEPDKKSKTSARSVPENRVSSKPSAPVATTWHADNPSQPPCNNIDMDHNGTSGTFAMDLSQAYPTQAAQETQETQATEENGERDYESHYDSKVHEPGTPVSTTSRQEKDDEAKTNTTVEEENRTLLEDDTGAVDFGDVQDHLAGTEIATSPIAEGPSLANTRQNWKTRDSSSQQQSSVRRHDGDAPFNPDSMAPETPAPPKNPFQGGMKFHGQALVAASQLFGQTQQLSSAVKPGFSPTSSRPSPNLLHMQHSNSPNSIDSPLRHPFNPTSPTASPSSPGAPATGQRPGSASASDPVAALEETPAPNRRVEDSAAETPCGTITRPLRRRPEPMDKYEPMRESQERRSSGEVLREDGRRSGDYDDDEDDDNAMDSMARHKRAAAKKEAAAKGLANISCVRSTSRDSVEVPATTQKPRKAQTGTHRHDRDARHHSDVDSKEVDPQDDVSAVVDSQEPAPAPPSLTRKAEVPPQAPDSPSRTRGSQSVTSSYELVPDSTEETTRPRRAKIPPSNETTDSSFKRVDMIPATSPATISISRETAIVAPEGPEAVLSSQTKPTAHIVAGRHDQAAGSAVPEPSLPQPSRRSSRQPRPSAKASMNSDEETPVSWRRKSRRTLPHPAVVTSEPDDTKIGSDPSVIPESSPQVHRQPEQQTNDLPSSPPITAQPKDATELSRTRPTTRQATRRVISSTAPAIVPGSASSLSTLSATPSHSSSSGSPATQASGEKAHGSSARVRNQQQARPALPTLHMLSTGSQPTTSRRPRLSRRLARLESESNDELVTTPSPAGFENSMAKPQNASIRGVGGRFSSLLGPKSRVSLGGTAEAKLFSGMAFAISFQSKKPGDTDEAYDKRLALRGDLEKLISDAGGRVLGQGFDELFDSTPLKNAAVSPAAKGVQSDQQRPLMLTPASRSLGFTALIADGHSRKVKYMQALALGLPCLSDRWVATCLKRKEIVDWTPYLLCAGQSAYLRDAVRSRSLATYAASGPEARLADVVDRREHMLDGCKILFVMKRSKLEEKKMPYVFLAHVLGATLLRAYSVPEAREMMRQREASDGPFDFVYVDEHTGDEKELFRASKDAASGSRNGRKRKRSSASGAKPSDPGPAPKKIRTLNDELIIQSLILGRMIEEGELDE